MNVPQMPRMWICMAGDYREAGQVSGNPE
jgi:hypothetical protein